VQAFFLQHFAFKNFNKSNFYKRIKIKKMGKKYYYYKGGKKVVSCVNNIPEIKKGNLELRY
jgi:hypothetical protein